MAGDQPGKKPAQWQIGERFPLNPPGAIKWQTLAKLPPSFPTVEKTTTWLELLPPAMDYLAKILEKITGSAHPFQHQKEAIRTLLSTKQPLKNRDSGIIINGGTQSGKTISFLVPGIAKLLQGVESPEETEGLDFLVIFYPTKQLLQDQYSRIKELLIAIERETGKRLTCKVYSGDIGQSEGNDPRARAAEARELRETEENPPNILLATFDKVWYQLITGQESTLLKKD